MKQLVLVLSWLPALPNALRLGTCKPEILVESSVTSGKNLILYEAPFFLQNLLLCGSFEPLPPTPGDSAFEFQKFC